MRNVGAPSSIAVQPLWQAQPLGHEGIKLRHAEIAEAQLRKNGSRAGKSVRKVREDRDVRLIDDAQG